jgi:hypothetical protein
MSKGPWKKKQVNGAALNLNAVTDKPKLGHLDPLTAAQETARNAQEGNLKLARAVDALRTGLETISVAEIDNTTGLPVTAQELRILAVSALDAYSALTGQSWRRHKIVNSRAGDRNLATLDT